MVNVHQLQNLDPVAWTNLLAMEPETRDIVVTDVDIESCAPGQNVVRYLLALAGHSDPVSFIGKRTNAIEARFYRCVAPEIGLLAPHCWFSYLNGDQSWIVLDEVPNDRPTESWTFDDVDEIIDSMATLHAAFWKRENYLDRFDWIPRYFNRPAPFDVENIEEGRTAANGGSRKSAGHKWNPNKYISDHTIQSSGHLAPALIKAAAGVQAMQELGGWPGVISEAHLRAAADLLDDPVPMLYPLRQLPNTLIHGDPSIYHWRLSLFEDRRLLDWQKVAIGPAVCDLISFVDQFDLLQDDKGWWCLRDTWPASEETIIDSYMLAMSTKLGPNFSARAVRQAIPAARCLYILSVWLPRFADWFQQIPSAPFTWQVIRRMSEKQLTAVGLDGLAGIRPYLAGVFKRFLSAYMTL